MLTFLALLLSQTPQHRLFRQPNMPREDLAFFEAFPVSGAGTSGPCSTTPPTGARGEVLTFTRASTATCTKTAAGGLATTGIANGDLVTLSSNVARVEYDSAGTLGTLGLLVEAARTNINLRSEEINDAAWVDIASPTAPTLNGACGTSPLAAPFSMPEDYTFAATTGADSSGRRGANPTGCGSVACTYSYFVKGVSGSGTLDVCGWGSTATCASCAYTDTGWARCSVTATIAGSPSVFIGNSSGQNGGIARSSNRVCVTAAQAEPGTYATSYIPTVAAAVTRAAEVSTFPGATWPTATYSLAASVVTEWGGTQAATGQGPMEGQIGANSGVGWFFYSGNLRAQNLTAGADNFIDATWTPTAGTQYRIATSNDGTSQTIFSAGVAISGPTARAPPDAPWATATGVGYAPAFPLQLNGIISRVCVDPNPERCR